MAMPVENSQRADALWLVIFLFSGVALAVVFQFPFMGGPQSAATAFWVLAALAFFAVHNKNFALLGRLILILYCVTLGASLLLLVSDTTLFWQKPLSRLLSADPDVVRAMMLMAAVGLCGLTAGIIAGNRMPTGKMRLPDAAAPLPPLEIRVFCVILLISIGLSAIAAPEQTILSAPYAVGQSPALSASIGFNSASLIGLIGLALLYIDAARGQGDAAWIKKILVAAASIFVLVYFQILRGDRDGFTFILAIAALYIVGPQTGRQNSYHPNATRKRLLKIFVPLLLLVLFGVILGILRTELTTTGASALTVERVVNALIYNTPTATVVTLLGAAAYHVNTGVEYLMGQSYVDMLLSLPPGLITSAIGIERPWEASHGPAWWFTGLSSGGIHLAVLPFLNFGIFGLLPVMGIIGFVFGVIEGALARSGGVTARLFYAAAFCASAKFVWYGELPLIRAMMTAGLIAAIYHLLIFMRRRYPSYKSPATTRSQ